MDNCFISLMTAVQKDIHDQKFKVGFKDWVSKNKKVFYDYVLAVFEKYKRSDP